MGVLIGAKVEAGFDNPIGLLRDCHRRVERFLGVLCALAEAGAQLREEDRTSLETALRYFREASPRHTADEEGSLFPRLRSLGTEEARVAIEALDALEADHAAATHLHAEMEELGREWLEAGALALEELQRFRRAARALREIYAAHIEIEERVVFPVAARALGEKKLECVGREMAARRGLR